MNLQPESDTGVFEEQPLEQVDLAPQACQSCRKQRRKCDKCLPSCGLCLRIGRTCDYSVENGVSDTAPTSEDFAALQQQVADLQQLIQGSMLVNAAPHGTGLIVEGRNAFGNGDGNGIHQPLLPRPETGQHAIEPAGASEFPAVYFLDSYAFKNERVQIQSPFIRVPPGALSALGSSAALRAMIEHYFDTVHIYFPIISKIRLYSRLSVPANEPGGDTALLFLAMKLICSDVPERQSAQSRLYKDVKSFYHHVEAQSGFSMAAIQALLLVCLYECGHAIFPAAYLSAGHAARLGYAAGLHDRGAPQMFGRTSSWTEGEERRRVWWAVIMLDRFVHIGSRDKPFSTSEPQQDTILPTDDASWDRGQMLAAAPLALSASNSVPATPFARVCQAAYLLGKTLRHLDDKSLPAEYTFEEGIQLHRTISALADVLSSEIENGDPLVQPMLSTSLGLCFSGLSTLYDAHMCMERQAKSPSESQMILQQASIDGLGDISERAIQLGRRIRHIIDTAGLNRVSPLIIDCFYQASANFLWYVRENSNSSCRERADELKDLLAILHRRWRAGGTYLFILSETWSNPATHDLCK